VGGILPSALPRLISLHPKAETQKAGFESTCRQQCFLGFTLKKTALHTKPLQNATHSQGF